MAKKILVIDDEELIVRTLKKLLEKNGFSVFLAKNAQDALIMAEEEPFDLIVADIRMPGINGVEMLKEMYEGFRQRNVPRVPAIFITGYADEEQARQAKELQPLAYIFKPFDIPELVGRIKEALK